MTPFERDWGISPGAGPRVFSTALGLIGVAICYDSEFPLLVRAMTEAGARLILIPSCTDKVSGFNRVRTAARARALENTCACVTSPTVGEAPWSPAVDVNTGMAGVFVPAEAGVSPNGILAEGRLDEPGWVYATIDLAALDRLRSSGEMRNDADWSKQPGAGALPPVDTIDLR
jgi:predicted amidohydrolase